MAHSLRKTQTRFARVIMLTPMDVVANGDEERVQPFKAVLIVGSAI
jgi:hypothetical protein